MLAIGGVVVRSCGGFTTLVLIVWMVNLNAAENLLLLYMLQFRQNTYTLDTVYSVRECQCDMNVNVLVDGFKLGRINNALACTKK